MSAARSLTLREISGFFFPLLLSVQLMSVSQAIINAALARQKDIVTSLAAFAVAMVVHLFLASPSYQNHTVTIALVRGRRSLRGVLFYVLLVAAYVSVMLNLVAHTVVGDLVLGDVLGVSGAVARGARSALALLAFLPFFTGLRGLFQGLVIQARRTALVSFATGVRIGALLLFLLMGSRWFDGPALGAFGLLACIVVETLLMGFFAYRCHLPPSDVEEKSAREIFRFGLPLACSSGLQQTIPLVISAVISRFPDGPLALASFGVIRSLTMLLGGPMRNRQQAYLTLVKSAKDYGTLVVFFRRISGVLALLMLLIAFPANRLILGDLIGLDESMRAYIALPLAACALYPALYGLSNLMRGYFAGAHRTSLLGRATLYKLVYLLACWALLALVPLPVSGIAAAIFFLLSCEAIEGGYLRWRRGRQPAGVPLPV